MSHAIRTGWTIVILAIFIFSSRALADSPATQPAGDQTAQKFLLGLTNDKVSAMTVDQAMEIIAYDPTSDAEKADAKASAANYITVSKIELAARNKWGKDAEAEVAHALGDNTPDDITTGDWAIDGDQAVVQFKAKDLSPLALIKKDGKWKVDLAGECKLQNETIDDDAKDQKSAATMLDQLNKDIASKDAYPTVDAFVQHVKDEAAKMGQ
jgi:hypothetical protein